MKIDTYLFGLSVIILINSCKRLLNMILEVIVKTFSCSHRRGVVKLPLASKYLIFVARKKFNW